MKLNSSVTVGVACLLLAGMAGCSSTPRLPQQRTTTRNQATDQRTRAEDAFRRNRVEEAELFYRNALHLSQGIDHSPGVAQALLGLGSVYLRRNLLEDAQFYILQAAEIATRESLNDLQVWSDIRLAQLQLRRGDHHGALTQLEQAEANADSGSMEMAVLLQVRGSALRRTHSYSEAGDALEQSFELARANDDPVAAAAARYQLASVYSVQGDYTRALEYLQESLEIDRQMENAAGIGASLEAAAAVHLHMQQEAEATDYLKRAYGVYHGIQDQTSLTRVAQQIREITGVQVTDRIDSDITIWEQLRE